MESFWAPFFVSVGTVSTALFAYLTARSVKYAKKEYSIAHQGVQDTLTTGTGLSVGEYVVRIHHNILRVSRRVQRVEDHLGLAPLSGGKMDCLDSDGNLEGSDDDT